MALPANLEAPGAVGNRPDRERPGVPDAAVSMPPPHHRSEPRRATTPSAGDRPGPGDGVAFVFQGGGSLTATQVGMLWALSEAGVTPDLVVGSSAGALNAVAFASDPSPEGLDRLEATWMSLRRRHVAPFSPRTLLAALSGRGDGLVPNSALRALIETAAVAPTLRETAIPAHVMVTELASGAAVALSDGETVPALLASCAFPGLYPPVEIGARLFVDGGVSADLPILQAEALGATVSYVLPAAAYEPARSRPRGPLPLAYHALGQLLDSVDRRDVAAAHGPVHLLPAPTGRATNPVDFRDTPWLINEAYRLATDWLADHLIRPGSAPRGQASSTDQSTNLVLGAI